MVQLVNPRTGQSLRKEGDRLIDEDGNAFPIIGGIPRLCPPENYASSFGEQWNRFQRTQIDSHLGSSPSEQRFFAETNWRPEELDGLDILEVGSGAGRFSRVVLERTKANLWSVDYSNAVEANLANNGAIAPDRLHLFQASIYEMPFPDGSFDKTFCLGVLQHTPDFEASVQALIQKTRPGGEIVVDFYSIRGFWTKIHAKYLLRPLTKRMSTARLQSLIEDNVDWLIDVSDLLRKLRLGVLTRFLPLVDMTTLPGSLNRDQRREWAVLDTFDMFSPEYDNPQPREKVAAMFTRYGADVRLADWVHNGMSRSAVVRALRR